MSRLSGHELQPCQFRIQPTLGQQTLMCALRHDSAAIEHHDAVGALHGGEAVGDDQGGAAFFEAFQGLLDGRFGLRVEG